MSKDKSPLSPTLIRFQQDAQINGLTERSQESYCVEGLYLTGNMGATRLANSENGATILSFNAKDYGCALG